MKQGDYGVIAHDTTLHGIPIGTKVQITSITDDDFHVFYDGKYRLINDADVAGYVEPEKSNTLLKKSIPQLFWNLIVELWVLFLLTIARWSMNMSVKIVDVADKKMNSNVKNDKKVVGVVCMYYSQFQQFLKYNQNKNVKYIQIGHGTTITGFSFDEIVKGPQWWVVPADQINQALAHLKKKPNDKKATA